MLQTWRWLCSFLISTCKNTSHSAMLENSSLLPPSDRWSWKSPGNSWKCILRPALASFLQKPWAIQLEPKDDTSDSQKLHTNWERKIKALKHLFWECNLKTSCIRNGLIPDLLVYALVLSRSSSYFHGRVRSHKQMSPMNTEPEHKAPEAHQFTDIQTSFKPLKLITTAFLRSVL